MKTPEHIRTNLQAAKLGFAQYRDSEQTQQLVLLLDALADQYLLHLTTITPEKLAYTQGALAQVTALRHIVRHDNPHLSALA